MDLGYVAGVVTAVFIFIIGAVSYQAGKNAERNKMEEVPKGIRLIKKDGEDASNN